MSRNPELDAFAREILVRNDRGGYTVPTHGLYPFQWNWASTFVALGFAEFDRDRAWAEIETLVSAQWEDGMIPHIVFHQKDEGYFPVTMLGFLGAGSSTVALPAIAVHTGLAAGFAMMAGLYALAVIALLAGRPLVRGAIGRMAAEAAHG